jgi:hypothetical protein
MLGDLSSTSTSIARLHCILDGIEDFRIERGDTLAKPRAFSLGCRASVHGTRLPAMENCGDSQTVAWVPL